MLTWPANATVHYKSCGVCTVKVNFKRYLRRTVALTTVTRALHRDVYVDNVSMRFTQQHVYA
jgi:hypothetical protein